MEPNDTSTNTDVSGVSSIYDPSESVNENNGEQYNFDDSILGDHIKIKIQDKQTHARRMKDLCTLYNFHQNKDKTGMTATTEIDGHKLAIKTSYNNLDIEAKGVMALKWRGTIFRHLEEKSQDNVPSKFIQPKQLSPEPTLRKSKSLIMKIKDLASSTNEKYAKEIKKAKKSGDKDYEDKLVEGWKSGTDLRTIKKKGVYGHPVNRYMLRSNDNDQTSPKQIVHIPTLNRVQNGPKPETNTSSTPKKDEQKQKENKGSKQSVSTNTESHGEATTMQTTASQTNAEDNQNQTDVLQQEIRKLNKENQKLITKNDEQASQMSKLLDSTESLKRTLRDTQEKASEQSKHITGLSSKSNNLETELNDLKESLAERSAECLIQEEENLKLKLTIRKMKDENRRLSAKLSEQSSAEDQRKEEEKNVDDDIAVLKLELHQLKQKMETSASVSDVMQLRHQQKENTEEISNLKSELKKQSDKSKQTPITADSNSQKKRSPDQTTEKRQEPETPATQNDKPPKPKVLILGDDVTGVLDRQRLQGNEIDLTISSNMEARTADIRTTIKSLPMKEYEVVVTHMGINNISDANSPQTIFTEYKDALQTVKAKYKCKIIVSSVLPKKHDKLSRKNIDELNKLLNDYCTENDMTFINNTTMFEKEDRNVDKSLYRNDIHLNSKGAAVLAKQMKTAIFGILNIQRTVNFRQAQRNQTAPYHRPPWNQRARHQSPWTGYHQHYQMGYHNHRRRPY